MGAARAMTGMATSVIGCKCEAGIDLKLSPNETPDGRPGYSILVFTIDKESLGKRLIERSYEESSQMEGASRPGASRTR